jgi:hypothetical protein
LCKSEIRKWWRDKRPEVGTGEPSGWKIPRPEKLLLVLLDKADEKDVSNESSGREVSG